MSVLSESEVYKAQMDTEENGLIAQIIILWFVLSGSLSFVTFVSFVA